MEDLNRPGVAIYDRVTGRWGLVAKLCAPGEYVSPLNDKPVPDPVLLLTTGESFVVREDEPGRFVEMDTAEHDFLRFVSKLFAETIVAVARTPLAQKLDRTTALTMIAGEMRHAAAIADAAARKSDDGKIEP